MEGVISEIRLWAANFAPRNWMFCQGQLLPIAQYTALFSLLGTTYGGNGVSNFALPNMAGRVPIGAGNAPGLNPVMLGEAKGSETVTLMPNNLPPHNHLIRVSNKFSGGDHPAGKYLGASANDKGFYAEMTDGSTLAPDTVTPFGSAMPFDIHQPQLGLNYVICVYGIFPDRG